MTTLIEELPGRIADLEAKFGSDNKFVKDLKEQLRASLETSGKSAQEVYQMQAVQFAPAAKTNLPNAPKREDFKTQAEFEEAQGGWQSRVGRIRGMAGVKQTAA